jgi:L-ascorbate metabolism protein UlaG (beta-lactamase superfamily)
MLSQSHKKTTQATFNILADLDNEIDLLPIQSLVANEAGKVDDYKDLEFVDVDFGRDDPHVESAGINDDEPHYVSDGFNLTAFNHFIDVRKGSGTFDDYDGYSYHNGSASKDEFQDASEATEGLFRSILAGIIGKKVDEGINWFFNDEYVHAPGQPWYRGCSPSLERYSYFEDKGRFRSREDEMKARFPLADSTGQTDKGVPYSIFMPVDNMARYWYEHFINTQDPIALGPVMHAIQDASIPHHAAGCSGNWHSKYESVLESKLDRWLHDDDFITHVKNLYNQWREVDHSPPEHLNISDWNKRPALSWRIDQLVTWVALNAYQAYSRTYNHFREGYQFDDENAKKLTQIAVAMGALVLKKTCTVWECWLKRSSLATQVKLDNGGIIGVFNTKQEAEAEKTTHNPQQKNGKWECCLQENTKAIHVKCYDSGIIGVFLSYADAAAEKERNYPWSKKKQINYARPTVRWLGAAGVEFRFDNRVFLVDPYFSRTVAGVGDIMFADVNPADNDQPISNYIDYLVKSKTPIEAILIGHTHWDHCADVPLIIQKHQAAFSLTPKVYGSWSCSNLLHHDALDSSFESLEPIDPSSHKGVGRTIYESSAKRVVLVPYSAAHNSPVLYEGSISRTTKPEKVRDYKMGKMLAFELKFIDKETTVQVYIGPACDHPALEAIKQIDEDIDYAVLAVVDWIRFNGRPADVQEGVKEALRHIKPKRLLPIHFDNVCTQLPSSELRPHHIPEDIPFGKWFGFGFMDTPEEEFKTFVNEVSQIVDLVIPEMFKVYFL